MSKVDKARVVELQRQVRIAREALEKIKDGDRDPYAAADEALYAMMPLDRKYPLQGLVGHATKEPTS